MMDMTEEMENPEVFPDTEETGEPEENAVPEDADAETSEPEIPSDGNLSGDDGTEPEEGGTDDGADGTETDTGGTGDGTETDGTETPPGSISVSGNILVLPEGYEFGPETFGLSGETDTETGLSPEQLTQLSEQLEQVEDAVTDQTEVLYGGTAVVSLVLGAVLGILLLHGFRMRRV